MAYARSKQAEYHPEGLNRAIFYCQSSCLTIKQVSLLFMLSDLLPKASEFLRKDISGNKSGLVSCVQPISLRNGCRVVVFEPRFAALAFSTSCGCKQIFKGLSLSSLSPLLWLTGPYTVLIHNFYVSRSEVGINPLFISQ